MPPFDIKLATSDADIGRCFAVVHTLRPHVVSADDLIARVRRMEKEIGWKLIYVEDEGEPVAAASFRIMEYLYSGKTLYVDDLVCLEDKRGKGFAEALMLWMEDLARKEGCETFSLDSGTQRLPAHRFYHRMKMGITSFHFAKRL